VYSRIAYYFECVIAISYSFFIRRLLFKPNNHTAGSSIDLRHKLNLAIPLFVVALVDTNSVNPQDSWKREIPKT